MKRVLFFVLAMLGCAALVGDPTATDLNEGLQVSFDPATASVQLSWWGRAGRTYFIQQSDDLINWTYLPVIESGNDDLIEWGCNSSASGGFYRLCYSDIPTTDPFNDDFDGDGISNWDELMAGSNPNDPISTPRDPTGTGNGKAPTRPMQRNPNPQSPDPHTSDPNYDSDGDGVPDNNDAVTYDNSLSFPPSSVPRYAVLDLGPSLGLTAWGPQGDLIWGVEDDEDPSISLRLIYWSPITGQTTDISTKNPGYDSNDPSKDFRLFPTSISAAGVVVGDSKNYNDSNAAANSAMYQPFTWSIEDGFHWLGDPVYLASGGEVNPSGRPVLGGSFIYWVVTYDKDDSAGGSDSYNALMKYSLAGGDGAALWENPVPSLPDPPSDPPEDPEDKRPLGSVDTYTANIAASNANGLIYEVHHVTTTYIAVPNNDASGPVWTVESDGDTPPVEHVSTTLLYGDEQSASLQTDVLLDSADTFTSLNGENPPCVGSQHTTEGQTPEADIWLPSENWETRHPIYSCAYNFTQSPPTPLTTVGAMDDKRRMLVSGDMEGQQIQNAMWANGQLLNFQDLVSPTDWNQYDPNAWTFYDLQGSGMIVAAGQPTGSGQNHSVILLPIELLDLKQQTDAAAANVNVLTLSRAASSFLLSKLPIGASSPETAAQEMQYLLRQLGYNIYYGNGKNKDPDAEIRFGKFGTTTLSALQQFQSDSQLNVSSQCDATTIQEIIRQASLQDPVAWIEPHMAPNNAPQMPQLVLRCGGVPTFSFKAKIHVGYTRPYGNSDTNAPPMTSSYDLPNGGAYSAATAGDQVWNIHSIYDGQPFFGGVAYLTYDILTQNGTPIGGDRTWRFRIGGKDPTPDLCKTYIQSKAASLSKFSYAIAKHESAAYNPLHRYYNQFWEHNVIEHAQRVNPGVNYNFLPGEPLCVRSDQAKEKGVGAVGLMQLTGAGGEPSISLDEEYYWNWQKNADGAIAEMLSADKAGAAQTFENDVTTAWGDPPANLEVKYYDKDENKTFTVTNTVGTSTLDTKDATTILLYNGKKGLNSVSLTIGDQKVREVGLWRNAWQTQDNVFNYLFNTIKNMEP